MISEQINIHFAKTNLSKILESVEQGREVVIARAGKPVARLVKFEEVTPKRRLGQWEGQIWMAPDFDAVDDEIAAMFNGPEE